MVAIATEYMASTNFAVFKWPFIVSLGVFVKHLLLDNDSVYNKYLTVQR